MASVNQTKEEKIYSKVNININKQLWKKVEALEGNADLRKYLFTNVAPPKIYDYRAK